MLLRQDFTLIDLETGTGVRVEIGASLALLALVLVRVTDGTASFLHDAAVFVLLLGSLHVREIARAALVRALGLRVLGVTLCGAGGRVHHSPARAEEEELIAATGPLVSLALWAGAVLGAGLAPEGSVAAHWFGVAAFVNLFVAVFTAMPVQPLDGGRWLALWLQRHAGVAVARRVCGTLGLALAAVWLPATLVAFLLCGITLIAMPSLREHWDMACGRPALPDA